MLTVFIDPNELCESHIGVIVEYATGVLYEQQCGGTATELRSVEGYYVPVGGILEGKVLTAEQLQSPFHTRRGCVWGPIQSDRLPELNRIVESIPYEASEVDRGCLRMDQTRLPEIVEAWVPVLIPNGQRAILTWQNCD